MLTSRWSGKHPWDLDEIDAAIKDTEKYPEEGAWEYSIKYILITLLSSLFHIKTSDEKVEACYVRAKNLCRSLARGSRTLYEAYLEGLQDMWPKLSEQLRDPGFYKFVQKFGMESAFLLPYLSVLSPHAPALEAAAGYSVDMAGVYRKIPKSDRQGLELCVREPTLRSFCARTWGAQEEMLGAVVDAQTNGWEKPNVFFAAAGMLPAVRRYHLKPEMLKGLFGRMVAYDSDPKMPEYLQMVFERPVNEYGIEYHFEDLNQAFSDPDLQGKFQVLIATGIMSYYKSAAQTDYMLTGFKNLLAPGGAMFFDVQVMEWSMIRCAVSLAWKCDLKPDRDTKSVIDRISRHAKALGLVVEHSQVDPYNTHPTLVNFSLRKPR